MQYFKVVVLLHLTTTMVASSTVLASAPVDYERQVRPLLHQKCGACHGALKQSAGLRLDAGELILRGSSDALVVRPGDSNSSGLIERVTSTDASLRMPPHGEGEKLTDKQVELLKEWIDQGAVFPANESIPEDPVRYWSYQPVASQQPPTVANSDWVRSPVDAFVAAEHQKHGLTPAPEATSDIWLRRVYLDLIGLPPTRQELHDFLQNRSADAYEQVVDQLLERPEYGERWGRHWMDVWRYSDWYGSRGGNEIRYSQRHIWRWRDWIVESLNADKPYDQMVLEMLAGDETAPADPDILRATGFLGRNWYKFDRDVWMFETVEQTSQAFLGLTMRCARCHDHKFDPITQEDYYRLRAFFEPHGVRTDPVSGNLESEKDATLGAVLKNGVARVFDQQPAAATFLFQRGDSRFPDTSRPLAPAAPAALGGSEILIQPIQLEVEAFYPALRPAVVSGLIAAAEQSLQDETNQLAKKREEVVQAAQELALFQARSKAGEPGAEESGLTDELPGADSSSSAVLIDDFSERSDIWNVVSGDWQWQQGSLVEASVGDFATIVSSVNLPRDFSARVRYRTLQPGKYRSVGMSFDYLDQGNSQDVYTSTGDAAQSIQAFHRTNGQQHYPAAGIVSTSLQVGELTTVDIKVQGQQLQIVLNGQSMLDYTMPTPRRDGQFALWVHNGSAQFLDVHIQKLVPTLDELREQRQLAEHRAAAAEARVVTSGHELTALRARIDAERLKYADGDSETKAVAAMSASRAERQVAVAKAFEAVIEARQQRAMISAETPNTGESSATADADRKLADATTKHVEAIAALDSADGKYTPLGEVYPQSTTGRRLALARWLVNPQNPRTSRIAVNHIWLRHFGEALVPSVANFGLNGQRPSHPELLDWLSMELIRHNWRMKPIHRLLVLSSTYRQSSLPTPAGMVVDPQNRWLWRMNSRRMEAEVVRDSLLSTAGMLDLTRGGPEIPEADIQTVFRRSMYFRNTPNEKATFLESFDMANPNECYRRQESVMPKQALALMNSSLALEHSRLLAEQISAPLGDRDDEAAQSEFIVAAFETILTRRPSEQEIAACGRFLARNTIVVQSANEPTFAEIGQPTRRPPSTVSFQRARENLIHTLYSHNDFVTIR